MIRPSSSSLRNSSQFAQSPTRLEFAISTRGAHSWVLMTPTGLPDCTSNVSSSAGSRSGASGASCAGQVRAALPVPPYTTRSSGRSATSGSRLFISIRRGASCCQPLQEISLPRAARTGRAPVVVAMTSALADACAREPLLRDIRQVRASRGFCVHRDEVVGGELGRYRVERLFDRVVLLGRLDQRDDVLSGEQVLVIGKGDK